MRTLIHSITSVCLIWLAVCNYSHAVPATPDADPLNLALDAYRSHMEATRYQAALPYAERIAELVAEKDPLDPHEYALVLEHWAALQQNVKLYRKAEKNYQQSIAVVEEHIGAFAPALVSKLSRLGALYYQTGQFDKSLEVMRRAQHIIHRNSGVYSLDQLKIVDWITKINLRTNKPRAADVQQRYYYKISAANFGEDDPRIIPALTKLGHWFRRSGQYPSALDAFRRTLNLMEELQPEADMAMLEPLNALSSTLYLQGSCCADEPLARALDVVANSSSADRSDELDALMHLADMNLLQQRPGKANELYQKAWNMVAPQNAVSQKGKDLFGMPTRLGIAKTYDVVTAFRLATEGYTQPEMVGAEVFQVSNQKPESGESWSSTGRNKVSRQLVGEPLPLCYSQVVDLARAKNKDKLATFFMDLDFTVSKSGKVMKVEVLDSNTPYKLGRYVKNMLYTTRFRPRFVAGKPVLTEHVELRQTFESGPGRSHRQDTPVPFSASAIFEGCQLLAGN
jgi:tetratricopeptide (TPR) repeat protein